MSDLSSPVRWYVSPMEASLLGNGHPYHLPNSYNGSVGGAPQLVDALSIWGSTGGLVIAVIYLVALCYVIADYFSINKEKEELRRSLEERRAMSPKMGKTASVEEQFASARKRASDSASLLTPDLLPVQGRLKDAAYDVETLKAAHGVKHIAVIMDGNRRFGKQKAIEDRQRLEAGGAVTPGEAEENNGLKPSLANSFITNSKIYRSSLAVLKSVGMGEKVIGHKAGGEKLLDFARYCISFNIPILTVYAFSTENWNRPQEEIDLLMALFAYFFEQMREEAHKNGIYCRFIVGDASRLNPEILDLMRSIERDTRAIKERRITVNVCVSYGSRLEIAQACASLAADGVTITEENISGRLMRSLTEDDDEARANDSEVSTISQIRKNDPDILFRTSGESRISNFLLYQCAYSEMIFTKKPWPSIEESDLEAVLIEYCCRHRRFGK